MFSAFSLTEMGGRLNAVMVTVWNDQYVLVHYEIGVEMSIYLCLMAVTQAHASRQGAKK